LPGLNPFVVGSKRLIFTLDLEDHRPDDSYPKRYRGIARAILDFLDARGIEATVFVLGRLARDDPGLIREIARRGHEIAFHSFTHIHLTKETPARFRVETADNKKYLEDLIGKAVVGYRAPAFSLTRDSVWAVDAIGELGFSYSSSLLPANNSVFGFAGAPAHPFRWPNGLLEIPAPIARVGPVVMPFLGGIYLRYLPRRLVRRWLVRGDDRQCYWAYCHPHDFDHGQAFYRMKGVSLVVSMALWFNRKRTFEKLDAIFPLTGDAPKARSFASLIEAGEFAHAPAFEP